MALHIPNRIRFPIRSAAPAAGQPGPGAEARTGGKSVTVLMRTAVGHLRTIRSSTYTLDESTSWMNH